MKFSLALYTLELIYHGSSFIIYVRREGGVGLESVREHHV